MNTSDLIALGALVTALVSLLISVWGNCVARRALKISETEHLDKYKEVVGYLINGFKWNDSEHIYASFAVSYTNKSSSPNSFKDLVLEIEYYDAEGGFNKAKLSPLVGVMPVDLKENRKELNVPINLPPKETRSGWMTFQLPAAEGRKFHIDSYRLVATSTADKNTTLESYILQSVIKDEE